MMGAARRAGRRHLRAVDRLAGAARPLGDARRRRSCVVVVGVSLNYLYLPIRAAQYPPINEGEPLGFFSQALSDVLNRAQYGKPPVRTRQADLGSPARQLLAVLELAVRTRLGRLAQASRRRSSRLLGLDGLLAAAARGTAAPAWAAAHARSR